MRRTTRLTPLDAYQKAAERAQRIARIPFEEFKHARMILAANPEALEILNGVESNYYQNRIRAIVAQFEPAEGEQT